MKLQLNGTPITVEMARTLADLLEQEGYGGTKIATAVNGEFVPAPLRAAQDLNDGDMIEVLAPMQGG